MLKRLLSILFTTLVIILAPFCIFAQEDTDTIETPDEVIINGKRYQAVDDTKKGVEKNKKKTKPLDSTFVVENNKFQYYNNWLSFGGGVQQNLTYKRELGFAGGVDFNFHVKNTYLQVGALISGRKFSSYNNYQLHFGYVRRFEDKDYHFSAGMGVSYSSGYQIEPLDSVKTYTRFYNQPGLYIQGEVIKKVTYDVGIGACLFADWNKEQSMMGLRFTLYFSGAYTGKRYRDY